MNDSKFVKYHVDDVCILLVLKNADSEKLEAPIQILFFLSVHIFFSKLHDVCQTVLHHMGAKHFQYLKTRDVQSL